MNRFLRFGFDSLKMTRLGLNVVLTTRNDKRQPLPEECISLLGKTRREEGSLTPSTTLPSTPTNISMPSVSIWSCALLGLSRLIMANVSS